MSNLQFTPFTSQVSPQLWHQLSKLKIDVLKLSQDSIPLDATYSAGRTTVDRETGKEIGLGCVLNASGDGFLKDRFAPSPNVAIASGTVINYNTIEEFKDSNKKALFAQTANEIWNSFDTDKPDLTRFLLITFADLKKYKFFYWFAFPAFVPADPYTVQGDGLVSAESVLGHEKLQAIASVTPAHPAVFLLKPNGKDGYESANIGQYATFFKDTPEDSRIVAFLDPSSDPQSPGWPLLNILAYLFHIQPSVKCHRILCWRDTVAPGAGQWKSRFATVLIGANTVPGTRPSAVGWERNAQGKLSPRLADLGSSMDPLQLADQALGLNLKLMRWRILPQLNLETVADTKCLLLGAGTLGCYVARTLMAWGVKKISFVDSAKVSFSNPVRQPLFEFEDCLEGGKPKAECAADRLKKIYPGIDAKGYSMTIPMPGHPVSKELLEQTKKDVELLEMLIGEHDVVFLLMDSRESRWLPSIVAASKNKIVMNAALGFDTFVVMRHGPRATSFPKGHTGIKLGCYYCNDVVAPKDSLTDRTLDQMCTVTRPGLASIASSTCVELLVSMLQHPERLHAPAPPNDPKSVPGNAAEEQGEGTSILGLVPHQIRGYLGQFRNLLVTGQQFERCTGCSEKVIQAYEAEGFPMLLRAFNEEKYLEQLTGLDKLYEESEAALASADWAEGGGNSDEDDF
ncbi:E1-like protein-activating [Serendipita vermifera]|nr:E1-like protein-activating [Serendipita vermifera]